MPAFLCGGWYHDELPAHMGGGTPGFKVKSPTIPKRALLTSEELY